MPDITVKQYDTYPPWVMALTDDEGPIDLSTASTVKFVAKAVSGATTIGPSNAAITAEVTFTATLTAGNPNLTSVSSFTGLVEGDTIFGPGIPADAYIMEILPTAIVLNDAPLASGASVTVVAKRGMIAYTPTTADTSTPGVFACECSIHWDAGGTKIQKVPNSQAANPQLQIDPDLAGATE
jgi:hypothetical protein